MSDMTSEVGHEAGKSRNGNNEEEEPDGARFSPEEEAVSRNASRFPAIS